MATVPVQRIDVHTPILRRYLFLRPEEIVYRPDTAFGMQEAQSDCQVLGGIRTYGIVTGTQGNLRLYADRNEPEFLRMVLSIPTVFAQAPVSITAGIDGYFSEERRGALIVTALRDHQKGSVLFSDPYNIDVVPEELRMRSQGEKARSQ